MAKRPKSSGKIGLRDYRGKLAKLKRAGLVSPKIDARSHKPTRYMLAQIEKFNAVLEGKAKAIKTPSHAIAREYGDLYTVKFDRVVIPSQSGETGRYDRERESLIIKRSSGLPFGTKSIQQILEARESGTLPRLPRDTKTHRYFYAIPFRRGSRIERIYIDTLRELKKYMFGYEKTGFAGWQNYVEVIEAEIDPKVTPGSDDGTSAKIRGKGTNASRKAKAQPRDAKGRFTSKG